MDSPKPQERRGTRYSLNLPVSLTLAHKKMHARSENISLGGILLSSAFLIPEGSEVDVAVRVAALPQPGTEMTARGTVIRVEPKPTGNFSVAVVFERPIEFCFDLKPGAGAPIENRRLPQRKKAAAAGGTNVASAWLMET
jgi:PilZ domain